MHISAKNLLENANQYLYQLCLELPTRQVGKPGNRAATAYFSKIISSFHFTVDRPTFDCIDWSHQGTTLSIGEIPFQALVSPYSKGFRGRAQLSAVSKAAELEQGDFVDQILLLHGEIAKEQLMPKNFIFYNPDEHKRIIALLEKKQPRAIIASTGRNPDIAGGIYPFPLIEDGDFQIPSVYMTEEEGQRLMNFVGQKVDLKIRAQHKQTSGCNVIARKGIDSPLRVVVFAHIDSKADTPGVLDNASGIVVLLLLAELLAKYSGDLGIEIVALNGEDYYSAAGEMQYLKINENKFNDIMLGINLDGVGYHRGKTAFSLYNCHPVLSNMIKQVFINNPDFIEGDKWYQGDHGLFLMYQRPALAITSENFGELLANIVHTSKDNLEIVDPRILVSTAILLSDLIEVLNQNLQ